ncbi:MAG: tRNA (adenosine(37)-N6)-threonylcarbamoyltransferase complex dimerization subunit type 1 TsaB [Acidobacteria bacterium]|nr:tRNA (adenosine(37)-N6)-threonylcarbamoyltransferase complex dimerization subunit type 1 TsaB [Acidobacteriota bacterium]
MLVLAIDTASREGSIALARRGQAVAGVRLHERGAHARDLIARIDLMLRGAELRTDALEGIAVSIGPGSFTGVRIGMATGKGLAYTLGIGLLGMSTLEALARAVLPVAGSKEEPICPAIEAGRGEVYAALFQKDEGGVRRLDPDRSWDPGMLVGELPEGALVAGDGSATLMKAAAGTGRTLRDAGEIPPLATTIAIWGSLTLLPGATYTPGSPAPNYVRPSDAEAARRKK